MVRSGPGGYLAAQSVSRARPVNWTVSRGFTSTECGGWRSAYCARMGTKLLWTPETPWQNADRRSTRAVALARACCGASARLLDAGWRERNEKPAPPRGHFLAAARWKA